MNKMKYIGLISDPNFYERCQQVDEYIQGQENMIPAHNKIEELNRMGVACQKFQLCTTNYLWYLARHERAARTLAYFSDMIDVEIVR